jgi:two-component system, OmpR family, alkaline phosphatase synthesis response regulator PhoP
MLSYNVLVVDDDSGIRDLLEGLLKEEGYNVAAARNGREALELLEKRADLGPHVILLDLMMPILDGYAVMKTLAGNPQLRDSHAIIVMSAAQRLSESHFDIANALLPKPFAVDDVLETVSQWTRRISNPNDTGAHGVQPAT